MRRLLLALVIVVGCVSPAYAQEAVLSLSARDLLSVVLPLLITSGTFTWWVVRTTSDITRQIVLLESRVAANEKSIAEAIADRKELRQEIKDVANEGRSGRSKLYTHVAERFGHTPVR